MTTEKTCTVTEKSPARRNLCFVLLTVMGVLYELPVLVTQGIPLYPYGDVLFHLSRVVGMRNVWTSPASFLNFGHYGGMISLFYPWLTLYPMYLLYWIFGSYVLAYKIFCLLLTLVTLYISAWVMFRISGNGFSAVIFAILYSYSAYRFDNVFHRGGVGESIACAILPLVLLGVYHVFFGKSRSWGMLTLGMTLLAYTHNLTLFLSSLVIVFLFLLSFWFWDEKKERTLALFKAAGMAVLLSLGSLIPMLEMSRTNVLNIPGGSGKLLGESAFDLKTIVVNALRNQPTARGIGLFGLLALVFLVLFFLIRLIRKERLSDNKGIIFFFLSGGILFFAVSSILPWEWIGEVTILSSIQFIWRLNIWVTLLLFAAFAYCLPQWICAHRTRLAVIAGVCGLAVFLHYSAFLTLRQMGFSRLEEIYIASGDAVSYDYAPLTAKQYRDKTGLEQEGILADGRKIPAEVSISPDGTVFTAVVEVPKEGNAAVILDLPVFHYQQQECTLNGTRTETFTTDRGWTGLTVLPGQRYEVNIFYHYTPLARCAWAVSCGVLVLIVFSGFSRRRKLSQSI